MPPPIRSLRSSSLSCLLLTRQSLTRPSSLALTTTTISPQTPSRLSSSESHYDPPSGWLFGVPPGEKYKKEGWEGIFIYGFCGSLLVLGVGGWVFREDSSIQTWALEEARRRLEKEGILVDPSPEPAMSVSSSSVVSVVASVVGKE